MSALTVKDAIRKYSSLSIPVKTKHFKNPQIENLDADFLMTQFGFLCIGCGKLSKNKKNIIEHCKRCSLERISQALDNI